MSSVYELCLQPLFKRFLFTYQVDELKNHSGDETEFSREDEIMCSVLEEIS